MLLSGAEIIISILEKYNIEAIAGIPGGANLPLYNALYKSKIKHILARHEQGAAFIAHGQARATGKVGVCFVTSGPGATNALTAIADAKLDSIPLVCISGQVPYYNIGTDAFQEVDTYSLTIPITKHNFLVRNIHELVEKMTESFKIATEGRPGPVVIDVPKNVLLEKIEVDAFPSWVEPSYAHDFTREDVNRIAEMMHAAQKPVLFVGGGLNNASANEALLELAVKNQIPVATTLLGLGAFPPSHDLSLGMIGMHGARYTNMMMHEADLIIALGVRFDDRATGNVEKFCPNAKIVHVDIEDAEINKIKQSDHFVVANVKDILPLLNPMIREDKRSEWIDHMRQLKQEFPFVMPPADDEYQPLNVLTRIAHITGDDTIVTTDVGQHQMWAAQVYPFVRPRQLLTSGGLGTMGFGLPAAIGAAYEYPEKTVICISGDGSFLMNIQELATLKELDLNVKVVLFNNVALGMVRQQQELFYNENYMASKYECNPNFKMISEGFGIQAISISKEEGNMHLLGKALEEKGPCVIEIMIKQEANVYPMVPPGAGNLEMLGGDKYE